MMVDLKNLLIEYNCPDVESVRGMEIADCKLTILQIRDRLYVLGNILYEDIEKGIYVASIRAGFANMNRAVVAMQLNDKTLRLAGYAKEGIIKQKLLESAFQRIEDAAQGKQLTASSPKKHLLLFFLPVIMVVLCILLFRSMSASQSIDKGIGNLVDTLSSEPTVIVETAETEDSAHIKEVQLTLDATKEYNIAAKAFNALVEEYNNAVTETCIDNIEGLPVKLDALALESESFEDIEQIMSNGISEAMIAADTETILNMASQVENAIALVKQITAPSGEWVAEHLEKVDSIIGIQAVTESLDPDDLLGKDGGYVACIYFTVEGIDQTNIPGTSIVEKGTDAGGAVEVYATLEEAEARCEYLAGFDGTILYSGSYAIVGTMVVRTSYQLTNEQQYELTNAITKALTSQS